MKTCYNLQLYSKQQHFKNFKTLVNCIMQMQMHQLKNGSACLHLSMPIKTDDRKQDAATWCRKAAVQEWRTFRLLINVPSTLVLVCFKFQALRGTDDTCFKGTKCGQVLLNKRFENYSSACQSVTAVVYIFREQSYWFCCANLKQLSNE